MSSVSRNTYPTMIVAVLVLEEVVFFKLSIAKTPV